MSNSNSQDMVLAEDWEVLSNKSDVSSSSDVLLPQIHAASRLAAASPEREQRTPESAAEREHPSEAATEGKPEAEDLTPQTAAASAQAVPLPASSQAGTESGVLVDGSEAALGEGDGPTTIVLVGAIGSGKSASGNTILGQPAFTARHAAGPVTKQTDEAILEDGERSVIVVDTPGGYLLILASHHMRSPLKVFGGVGLGNTGSQAEAARQEVDKALAATAQRGGRLAVAIVCSVATPYSSADHAAVCSLVARFGAGVLKRSLLLFTGGDLLSADGAGLADYLADAPPDLQAVLQQVSGRTVLLDNRADDVGRQRQAGAFLAVVDGLLSGSQLGSFLAPGWAVDAAAEAPPAAAGALRAHIDGGLPEDAATIAAGVGADSRAVLGKDAHAARLAAALAASEARRMQLERTVRDMPRLRRGIAYALTAWSLEPCTLVAATDSMAENPLSVAVSPHYLDIASH